MRLPFLTAVVSLSLAVAVAAPAPACSICRCGDPTFNALGSNVHSQGAFRIALDWDRVEKSQAGGHHHAGRLGLLHEDEIVTEDMVEHRVTATFSYAFADRVNLVARIPYSSRRLTETTTHEEAARSALAPAHTVVEEISAKGLADPEIFGVVKLWSSAPSSGLGRRSWVSAVAGVKTPWGRNDMEEAGVRLDEHVQPGTGATDVFGGVAAAFLIDPSSTLFASVQARRTGTNDQGYRYGRSFLANLGYERKIASRLDAVLELNFRNAGRDVTDAAGETDENTGGSILYVSPRLAFAVSKGLVLRVGAQFPTARSLHGEQTERAVVSGGLTALF